MRPEVSRRYIGYTVTFKYILNELQMQQVHETVMKMQRLVASCDPIEVRENSDSNPLTEREDLLPLEEMRIK